MKTKSIITSQKLQEQRLRTEFEARLTPDRAFLNCPTCDTLHGLFYRVSTKGKKSLMYTCAKQKHFWYTANEKGEMVIEHWKHVTKTFEAPVFIDGLDIPLEWTPAKKQEFQKQHGLQLPMMIPKV